jgi:hypothetical protein
VHVVDVQQLVSQLDRKDDLLASWMSHYIAELMDNVANAPPDAKAAAQHTCAKAILELWQRRATWPERVRPFVQVEPVLRTLSSLDIDQTADRYYARERRDASGTASNEMGKWLAFATTVDNAARFLIRSAVRAATTSTKESIDPWVALVKNAGIDDSIETSLLDFLIKADESGDAKLQGEANLRLNLTHIETFLRLGGAFADEIRAYLNDLGSSQAADEDVALEEPTNARGTSE